MCNCSLEFLSHCIRRPGAYRGLRPFFLQDWLATQSSDLDVTIRDTIIAEVEALVTKPAGTPVPLSDDLTLLESGLDSLNFAILLARLDDKLQFDPFDGGDDFQYPGTLGDLVHLYERHVR